MKRKMTVLFLAAAMLLSTFSGCGGAAAEQSDGSIAASPASSAEPAQESVSEPAENDSGKAVTITYWDQNADTLRTEIYGSIIAEFEAENPNIKVEFVAVPAADAKSKYDVAIQSNTAPDCGGVSQYWISDFLAQNALVSLDQYVADWAESDQLIKIYEDIRR